mmetsp:Transcript_174124/g.558324  ORF Transcript_174124/g.558324 Transcript_174124/m.558324 type:complete len:349 (+) Transcript_174124:43-1089(+)
MSLRVPTMSTSVRWRRRAVTFAIAAAVFSCAGPAQVTPPPTTYAARLRLLLAKDDIRMAFVGRAEAERAQRLVALGSEGGASEVELEWARRVVAGTTHPSGYVIPRPLRAAAYPFMNVPLVLGCLLFSQSMVLLCLVQMINQTFNAIFNIANGAGIASGFKKRKVVRDLIPALMAACGMVLLAQRVERALPWRGSATSLLVAYLSVVAAGIVNLTLSRRSECTQGVPVSDAAGRPLATSRAAGRAGVARALITRSLLLPLVALVTPTVLMAGVEGLVPGLKQWKVVALSLEILFIAATLAIGLPACVALFPATVRMPFGALERSAQAEARRSVGDGRVPEHVFVFRGL